MVWVSGRRITRNALASKKPHVVQMLPLCPSRLLQNGCLHLFQRRIFSWNITRYYLPLELISGYPVMQERLKLEMFMKHIIRCFKSNIHPYLTLLHEEKKKQAVYVNTPRWNKVKENWNLLSYVTICLSDLPWFALKWKLQQLQNNLAQLNNLNLSLLNTVQRKLGFLTHSCPHHDDFSLNLFMIQILLVKHSNTSATLLHNGNLLKEKDEYLLCSRKESKHLLLMAIVYTGCLQRGLWLQ